jgi:hypothetical protein
VFYFPEKTRIRIPQEYARILDTYFQGISVYISTVKGKKWEIYAAKFSRTDEAAIFELVYEVWVDG